MAKAPPGAFSQPSRNLPAQALPRALKRNLSKTFPRPFLERSCRLCLELKRDREADQALGWVLEMWAYTLAAARTGVRHQAHLDFPRP